MYIGFVMWIPCTIYKSSCTIDVTYFPFDEQSCEMIFGSWTYNADEVNITWYLPEPSLYSEVDLSDYEKSGTWDLVGIPGKLSVKKNMNKAFVTYELKLGERRSSTPLISSSHPCSYPFSAWSSSTFRRTPARRRRCPCRSFSPWSSFSRSL